MASPPQPRDPQIEKARGGDREAFDQLVDGLRDRLERFVETRLGSSLRRKIDVEDIVQETFFRAFGAIGRFERTDEHSFFRWLGGIASNVVHETARRHKHELIALLDDTPAGGVSLSKDGERHERFDRLQAALDSLTPDHRRVIRLARLERLPLKEVAGRMDRTPEAVSQLLWRALKKLKEAFGSTDSFSLPERQLKDTGGTHGESG